MREPAKRPALTLEKGLKIHSSGGGNQLKGQPLVIHFTFSKTKLQEVHSARSRQTCREMCSIQMRPKINVLLNMWNILCGKTNTPHHSEHIDGDVFFFLNLRTVLEEHLLETAKHKNKESGGESPSSRTVASSTQPEIQWTWKLLSSLTEFELFTF